MIRELRTVRENYQDLINGPQRSLTLDIVQWTFCGSSDSIELCTFDGLPIGQAVLQLSRNTGLICKKKKKQQHKYNSPLAENKNSLTRVNLSLAIGAIGILI